MRVRCVLAALLLLVPAVGRAQTIEGHFRNRPPEMVVGADGSPSGPIKDVIEEAAQSIGLSIHWQVVPFARSLEALRSGEPVLVPRLRPEPERRTYIRYLGPIAVQLRQVRIAARPAIAAAILGYADLRPLRIATLRGSATFDAFDADGSLDKQAMTDDDGRVRLLEGNRVDAIISSDPATLARAFDQIHFADWAWAPYEFSIEVGNYYGIAKAGALASHGDALDAALRQLAERGEVAWIYRRYGLDAEALGEDHSPS